ncbi:OsmC family protein [Citrobacter telavivensis]
MAIGHNGLDIISLSTLRESIACQSQAALASFNVTTSWKGGFKSESACNPSVINGNTDLPTNKFIHADEPVTLGGTGISPNPQELMLAAFNACLTAAYVTAAVEAGVVLEKLQIQTSGALDLQGFLSRDGNIHSDSIRYTITVKGSGTRAQFEKIHQTVIATSPNRWIIGKNLLIEGDQIVEHSHS